MTTAAENQTKSKYGQKISPQYISDVSEQMEDTEWFQEVLRRSKISRKWWRKISRKK